MGIIVYTFRVSPQQQAFVPLKAFFMPLFLRVLPVLFISGNIWLPSHPTQTESQLLNLVKLLKNLYSLNTQCALAHLN